VLVLAVVPACDRLFELRHFPDASPVESVDARGPFDDAPLVPDGLIAHYTMEDAANGVVADIGGHMHDAHCATGSGTCPMQATGRILGGLDFDGQTNRIDVLAGGELETVAGFTVTAWLRLASAPSGSNMCPFQKIYGTADLNTWQLCVSPIAIPNFITQSAQGLDELYAPIANTIVVGQWYHVAIRMDATGVKTMSVNGADVASHAAMPAIYDQSPVTFGADRDGGVTAVGFPGTLDEIRIYNRVLSQNEIAMLAQAP